MTLKYIYRHIKKQRYKVEVFSNNTSDNRFNKTYNYLDCYYIKLGHNFIAGQMT
jgi:hypothetical protein